MESPWNIIGDKTPSSLMCHYKLTTEAAETYYKSREQCDTQSALQVEDVSSVVLTINNQ